MRKSVMLLVVLVIAFAALNLVAPSGAVAPGGGTPTPTPEPFTIAPDLTARVLAPGIIVITHAFPWPANALLVEMGSGDLVLVDTPYTPEATQDLLDWIAAEFGPRDLVAINTGFHVDNLGGNNALIDAGIPVYGADRTAELLADKGENARAYMLDWLTAPSDRRFRTAHAAIPFVPPDHLFALDEGLKLDFEGETVALFYPGAGHTVDNIMVFFPAQRVLFGGCLILAGDRVGNTHDADLEAWPYTIETLIAANYPIDWLIPGHGERTDPDLLAHTLALVE